jgi:ABC-2 type transport system permease protein
VNALDLRNPGLRDIFRMGVRRVYAYRMWTYLGVLQVFLQLMLLRAVWEAVYGDRESVDGVPIETMITYLSVVGLINFIIYPGIASEIARRIEQGQVAVDMVRPVGFVRQMLALEVGDSAGRWILLVVVIPGLMLIGSLAPPSPGAALLFLLSIALAFAVSVLMWLLVGLSSFWLMDIQGMRGLVGMTSSFLAGSMIPLWFMPGPLRAVVEWLPFQSINYLPASIWVGQATGWQVARALGIQLFWALALGMLAAWVWSRAQRRIVVQGG